jgi:hypothetical protein
MTFRHHCALVPLADILPPRRVNRPLARELWEIGAAAMKAQQKQHNLDAQAETYTEGRSWPRRVNIKDD